MTVIQKPVFSGGRAAPAVGLAAAATGDQRVPDTPAAPSPAQGPTVTREMLPVFGSMCGVACVLRDERMRLVWCNDAFARLSARPAEELVGTALEDFLPRPAADERALVMHRVMRTGVPEAYYQFGADKRLLCRVLACDTESFGAPMVLTMVQEAPVGTALRSEEALPVLSTPCLDQLAALSPSELRALYYLAQGLTTADIAERLCRATKTVEKHIESIHRKLGTSSRAGIVRLATERGLQAFTQDQWDEIIEGSKRVRRARR